MPLPSCVDFFWQMSYTIILKIKINGANPF
jgi:hypothetical protein